MTCEEYRTEKNIDSLSSLIRDVLEVTGMSSRELAEKFNVGNSTISDWKRGKFPRFRTQEVVSEALGELGPYGEIWSDIFDRLSENNNMKQPVAPVSVEINRRILRGNEDRYAQAWEMIQSSDPEFNGKRDALIEYFSGQLKYLPAHNRSCLCSNLASAILVLIKEFLYLIDAYCDDLGNKELTILISSQEHLQYSEAKERLNDFIVCIHILRACGLLNYRGERQFCVVLKECSYKMEVPEIIKRLGLENYEGIWFRHHLLNRIKNIYTGKEGCRKYYADIYTCALDLLGELYIAPDNVIRIKESGVQPRWDKDATLMQSVKRLWGRERNPKDSFRWKYAIEKNTCDITSILDESDYFPACGQDEQNFAYKTSLTPMYAIILFLNVAYYVSDTRKDNLRIIDVSVVRGTVPGSYDIRMSLTDAGKYIAGCLFDGRDMGLYYLDPTKRMNFYDWLCDSGNKIYCHANEFHDVNIVSCGEILFPDRRKDTSKAVIRNLIDTVTGWVINRYVFAGPIVPPTVWAEENFFELFKFEHPQLKVERKCIGERNYAYSWFKRDDNEDDDMSMSDVTSDDVPDKEEASHE